MKLLVRCCRIVCRLCLCWSWLCCWVRFFLVGSCWLGFGVCCLLVGFRCSWVSCRGLLGWLYRICLCWSLGCSSCCWWRCFCLGWFCRDCCWLVGWWWYIVWWLVVCVLLFRVVSVRLWKCCWGCRCGYLFWCCIWLLVVGGNWRWGCFRFCSWRWRSWWRCVGIGFVGWWGCRFVCCYWFWLVVLGLVVGCVLVCSWNCRLGFVCFFWVRCSFFWWFGRFFLVFWCCWYCYFFWLVCYGFGWLRFFW